VFDSVRELIILATCYRVEVYFEAEPPAERAVAAAVRSEVFGCDSSDSSPAMYEHSGVDAVRHLCRVACGLDSMVVGEHEIAGQVGRAFRDPLLARDGTGVLAAAAAAARKASRRVRADTDLGRHSASVSSVAVDLAREELNGLEGRAILVVGAGKAGRLVCQALGGAGAASLTVVNRSPERARILAEAIGASVASLEELPELLATADLVLMATSAEQPVLDMAGAAAALSARPTGSGPLLLLDLALPRDVDPAVSDLDGLWLLTLEDVKTRVDRHLSLRRDEVEPAEAVVAAVLADFVSRQDRSDVEAMITELRRDFELLRSREVDRWMNGGAAESSPSREDLDRLTRSIVDKLLHHPMARLRSSPAQNGRGETLFHTARELFGLDAEREPTPLPGQRGQLH
jgi:glutamyl-tRNA reductase